jgi:hypothetical protein
MTNHIKAKVELIHKSLQGLGYQPGEVLEARLLNTKRGTVSGYFDNPRQLAEEVAKFDGEVSIYFTINPVKHDLLARANNRLVERVKQTTSDADVERRRYLPIDLDPVRPSGISSTDEEHEAALALARNIWEELEVKGWPDPVYCDSGNGAHLLYAVDLPNDDTSRDLVSRVLQALDLKYSYDRVHVDTTTYNAARIWKLYGTTACKGDSTEDRPHRVAAVLEAPKDLQCVSVELLEELAAEAPKIEARTKKPKKGDNFDLDAWLEQHGVEVARKARWQNKGSKYVLKVCPWRTEHTDASAYIILFDNGGIAAGCHHASCSAENWATLRARYEPEEEEEDTGTTAADKLVRLGRKAHLFTNELQEAFASFPVNYHREIAKVTSKSFKLWLIREYFTAEGTAPPTDSLNAALGTLQAIAMFEGETHNLHVRVAELGDDFYYDLADKNWRVVRVTSEGCEVLEKAPLLFLRFKNTKEQVVPNFDGDLRKILKHCRVNNEDDQILLLVYIVSCLVPSIPHPVLVLAGEKGSAKSTTIRMVRSIVDPAPKELLSMPNSIQDLAICLYSNYMPSFDNMDTLSGEKSDMLCVASTGGGISRRMLYTDDEEIILHFKRCPTLNGINVVTTKPDLADRALFLELERIPKEERKTERQIWQEFDADRADIIGGALTALSKAMAIMPEVELDKLNRMADFTAWGYAIAEALGIGGERFLEAYDYNYSQSNREVLESHPVAAAVVALMTTRREWSGSVASLFTALEQVASEVSINTLLKYWPKAPNILSMRLREIKSNLEEIGIRFDVRHGGSSKIITLVNDHFNEVQQAEPEEHGPQELDLVTPSPTQPTPEKKPIKKVLRPNNPERMLKSMGLEE